MKYALSYIATVAVILGVCGAIVSGVYVGICHRDSLVTACKVGKE
jgi:hypothetical protein